MTHKEGTLIYDLLTENRFWTFWMPDWSEKVYVQWGGKTKFSVVKNAARKYLGIKRNGLIGYERQTEIKNPKLIFK
jgi:hypothetical protein